MSVASKQGQPAGKRVVCLTAIRRELVWDTHKQAHTGAQRLLTQLQLWWYWPYMEHEIRHRVRQCETCQANKHGCTPDEAGRWRQNVGGPWQVKAVDLVKNVPMAPQGDVAGRGRPLLSREARSPAPKPSPPLLEPSTGPEVQKTPAGRASSRDTKVATPSDQHTRQPPVHRKDLVCDRIICSRYKDSTEHRTGKRAKVRGSYEHHANINFCLSRITNEIQAPETKSPSHDLRPRCLLVPYADAVKSSCTSKQ